MIRIGWWLSTIGESQREAALGFNEVALERGWQVSMGIDPAFALEKQEYAAHVIGQELDESLLPWFASRKVVAAEWNLTARGIPSVHTDYASAGALAAEHLLERGLRDFAGFGTGTSRFWRERCAGFRAAVERAGRRYHASGECFSLRSHPPQRVNEGTPVATVRAAQALRTWLGRLPTPVGIFAGVDAWGRMLLPFVHQTGRQVPTEVAVVGVDNDEFLCELTQPSLSSVAIPWRQLGRRVGELVARLLAGDALAARSHLIQPAGVIARRSTDMLAVPDHAVAQALGFIQGNYLRNLTVTEVLRAVPTPRKKLEGGFRRHVGHGIMREIRRVRVERARQLLIMTDLGLELVAQRSGFVSAQKMTEIFGRIAGMPPSRYRRQFRLGRGAL